MLHEHQQPDQNWAPLGFRSSGTAEPVSDAERDDALGLYLAQHADAKQWAGFGDFKLYRQEIVDVYFVGGFGVMGWITTSQYAEAIPDPLAQYANEIMSHVNSDHNRAVIAIAKHQWGISATQAIMTSIDQHGFDAKLMTDQGPKGIRIKFPTAANEPNDVRTIMKQMVQDATA